MPKGGSDLGGDGAAGRESPLATSTSCDPVEVRELEDGLSKRREDGLSKAGVVGRCDSCLVKTTFFLIGWCSLFAWNNILYLLPYMTTQFLDGWDAGNSLLGVFQVGNLSSQLILLLVGTLFECWFHISLVLGSALCVALACCVTYGSVNLKIALLHVICLFFGACSGLLNGSGFSYAALMPTNQVGIISTGQGFGAVFSVVLIGILSFTALDLEVKNDVATLVYISSALTVSLSLLSALLVGTVIRRPAIKVGVADARAAQQSTAARSDTSSGAPETTGAASKEEAAKENKFSGVKEALGQAAAPIASIFIIFFVTCNLFPRVGPLQWYITNPPRNHLVWLLGVFPFGDTLGRCLCIFADKAECFNKIIMFPPKMLPWLCCLRFLLYVPFFLSKHLVDNVVFSAFWFQALEMIVISVTNGWFITIAFMYSFDAVSDVRHKRHVGPLGTLCIIMGIISADFRKAGARRLRFRRPRLRSHLLTRHACWGPQQEVCAGTSRFRPGSSRLLVD
ncbi:hypothetical protein Efla_004376 [Eimeria flavescens]